VEVLFNCTVRHFSQSCQLTNTSLFRLHSDSVGENETLTLKAVVFGFLMETETASENSNANTVLAVGSEVSFVTRIQSRSRWMNHEAQVELVTNPEISSFWHDWHQIVEEREMLSTLQIYYSTLVHTVRTVATTLTSSIHCTVSIINLSIFSLCRHCLSLLTNNAKWLFRLFSPSAVQFVCLIISLVVVLRNNHNFECR